MTDHAELADRYFKDGYLCSQAVFAAFAPRCGLTEAQALSIGACFGSGMCKGEVCGAVTGALMVIGAKYGHAGTDPLAGRARTNALTCLFLERFQNENGSYLCKDLLGYDVSLPEDLERIKRLGLFSDFCPKMVASAVKLLEEILAEKSE